MKLIYYILLRISLALTVILTAWAALFYVAVMDEVNDEMDDALDSYSETIIIRALAGEELPSAHTASNSQFFLREVPQDYADGRESIVYKDSMVYIPEKGETEPARILVTLFRGDDGRCFELTVSVPSIEKDDLKESVTGWIVFLYFLLLFIVILIMAWVIHRNMRPLYVLLDWLDKYRMGGSNEPLRNETGVAEFRKLNEAAVRHTERGERMFEQQKQFIGNASHEMQTPLAVCRNRLEMLMEDESLTEDQLEELARTHHTLEHITKLNKSLLLLSKIENGQFTETAQVAVNALLEHYLADYREVYAYRGITVEVQEEGEFVVRMNETLAAVLFTNLLKNAFVHNVDGGHIRIVLARHGVVFRNTGADGPLDGARIFDRFYQGGRKKEGSTGLGLAIADSICKMQSLRLDYFYEEGEHCFGVGL